MASNGVTDMTSNGVTDMTSNGVTDMSFNGVTDISSIDKMSTHSPIGSVASCSPIVELDFDLTVPVGPKLAYHCGCVINNMLYVHGGVTPNKHNDPPSNKLYRMNLEDKIWIEIRTEGSPKLSYHAAVQFQDKYLLVIGGWDGQVRSGKVYAYDTEEDRWICPKQTGFHHDAGLSSHTATLCSDGSIMIFGREGSLRMQRRFGSAFLLRGSVEKGFTFTFVSRMITSRSGHTTVMVNSKMYVIGGRNDEFLEYEKGFSGVSKPEAPCLKEIATATKHFQEMAKIPKCRKNHVAISGPGVIFMHGGLIFDGRYEAVGDMYLIRTKRCVEIINLGKSKVMRAGHICFSDGDYIYIHGGLTGKAVICGDMFTLKLEYI